MRRTDSDCDIEREVDENKEGIAPPIGELDVERSEEFVSHPELAVSASIAVASVVQITARYAHESASPLLACLAGWRVKYSKFVGVALDFEASAEEISVYSDVSRCKKAYFNSVESIADRTRVCDNP
jgi:hypothetical protein